MWEYVKEWRPVNEMEKDRCVLPCSAYIWSSTGEMVFPCQDSVQATLIDKNNIRKCSEGLLNMKCAHKSFTREPSLGCASHNNVQPTAFHINAPPGSYEWSFLELKPLHTTWDIFLEVRVVKRSRQGSLPFLLTFIPNFCLPFIDILCLLIHDYKIILMVCNRIKHLDLKNCVFKPH